MNKPVSLEEAYDVQQFRNLAAEVVEILSVYLDKSLHDGGDNVFQSLDPGDLYDYWKRTLESPSDQTSQQWLRYLAQTSIHLHNPRFMGHQVSPVLPAAALFDFVGSFLNNGMGVYEMGSPAVAMERAVIKKMALQFGFDETADGFLTSGGTLGNLTALLALRQIKAGYDAWNEGNADVNLGILVSEEAHYSISRAVKILGWGEAGMIKVPVDDRFRMDVSRLDACYDEAVRKGIRVIGVIGNAGSTGTGSYDPLQAIADFCAEKDLWFHVDAAHGGAAVFSENQRSALDGIQRADSLIIDFHKMLFCPALVTAVIFKRGEDSYQTFAQKASYLWEQEDAEWFNLGKRTFECTKSMMSLKAYFLLKEYGEDFFGKVVDRLFKSAQTLAGMIRKRDTFELLTEPMANIVCFRHLPKDNREPDEHNARIRRHLLEDGRYYIVQNRIRERLYLRSAIMNPFTTPHHFSDLLDEIGKIADHDV